MPAPIIIVEDGSLVLDANSYIDSIFCDTYFGNIGKDTDWLLLTTDQKSILIFRACEWLERLYQGKWNGYIVKETQSLSFPRYCLYDLECRLIPHTTIPKAIKEAQAEAILLFMSLEEEDLWRSIEPEGQVRRIGLADKSIEQEFFKTSIGFEETRYLTVEKKVTPYLKVHPTAKFFGIPKHRG